VELHRIVCRLSPGFFVVSLAFWLGFGVSGSIASSFPLLLACSDQGSLDVAVQATGVVSIFMRLDIGGSTDVLQGIAFVHGVARE
jgi:hypothetical protein